MAKDSTKNLERKDIEELFVRRLSKLRIEKNVSARDMSLSIGQSESYINRIESGKMLPSMTIFFSICDYLEISPSDFFKTDEEMCGRVLCAAKKLQEMDDVKREHILAIIDDL